MRTIFVCFVLAACGGSSSKSPDASNVPAMITVTGTANERGLSGSTPVAGVTVGAYKNSDETTAVATTTTDGSGNYTLTITTNGQALDGFVKATKTGYIDLYLYPPAPLTADYSGASLNMLTPSTFGLIYSFSQVSQDSTKGTIALEVVDASMNTIGGGTITSSPGGSYIYNGTNGVPDKTQTSTQSDGIAYDLNVGPGQVTLMASKSGSTFKAHAVNARAGVFTTTVVSE